MQQKKSKKHNLKDIFFGAIIATIFFTFIMPVIAAPLSKTVEVVYNYGNRLKKSQEKYSEQNVKCKRFKRQYLGKH